MHIPPRPDTLRTPCHLEVLLHCHLGGEPHPKAHAPAVAEALARLQSLGAIEMANHAEDGPVYQTTPLGAAWIKALCNVPFPREETIYLDEKGQVIR